MDAGLVVSICLGGAFLGCLFSGSVADGIGRRRAFQLSALPMIVGAAVRYIIYNLLTRVFSLNQCLYAVPSVNTFILLQLACSIAFLLCE
jgi:MFS family permease